MKLKFNASKAISATIWFVTLALAGSGHVSAVDIVGDTVQGHLTVTGDTTGSGWGWFKQGIDFGNSGEAMLNWTPGTSPAGTVTFDITWADGTFLWRDTLTTTANNKMSLDAANNLLLYKSNGTAGITLAPETGKITLPAGSGTSTGSGIYFGTGPNATLAASATGAAIFPSQVTLQNGLSVSSGNMNIASTTASTSSATGALTVAGGLGVGQDSYINGVRIGRGAGSSGKSTALGATALSANTTGAYNSANGYYALRSNTTGSHNSATGTYALNANTTGSHNSATGSSALYANTTGSYNSATGSYALQTNTTGGSNVAVGSDAGRFQSNGPVALTDPENSIYIGAGSRGKDNADNNSIVIGYQAIGEGANTTVIGNTATSKTRLFGDIEASAIKAPSAPNAKLMLKGQIVLEVPQGDISMGIYQ